MPGPSRRDIIFGGAMLGATGLSIAAQPPDPPRPLDSHRFEAAIPRTIGAYRHAPLTGLILPPRDDLSKQLYDGYVARAYAAADLAPIFLLVAFGSAQDYALQLHRPETCYPASGYTITQQGEPTLALGAASARTTLLTARRRGRTDLILYWTRIGEGFPTSPWEERALILRAALARRPISGVLVRISTALGDQPNTQIRLADFAKTLVATMAPRDARLLIGGA